MPEPRPTHAMRELELHEMATDEDGATLIMLEALSTLGHWGDIDATTEDLIEEILAHEYPEGDPFKVD